MKYCNRYVRFVGIKPINTLDNYIDKSDSNNNIVEVKK